MSHNFESEVIKALEGLLETGVNYDVIIYIGEKPNFKEFHAHSIFLSCRSIHFNQILSDKDVEKKNEKYVIKKSNISPQAFDVIIKYLYTGHVDITDKTGIEILNIIVASDDLNLNQLLKVSEDFFIEQKFIRIDPVEILQIIYCRKVFNKIQKSCLETICLEPEILFNSSKFINIPAPLLEIILKRDDLNLDEIEVWENLIRWGLAQEKSFNKDVSKWRQEDFNVFKRILYKFIPLIIFYNISSEDYFNKVRPYEDILSKELREEVLKFHMIPGYKPTPDNLLPKRPKYDYDSSVLINREHIRIFANWISKRADGSYRYSFKLLYHASRDGNTAVAFHQKCDNKGATIAVAKVTNSEQIIGGYNPLFWDQSQNYKSTNGSFIFSFTNRTNLQTANVGYCNNDFNQYSICCHSANGPTFGGGHDLRFCNNNAWHKTHSYPKIDGIPTRNFNIDDYEVFQVIRK